MNKTIIVYIKLTFLLLPPHKEIPKNVDKYYNLTEL